MAKIKVGYAPDWFGQATQKLQIIAETTDGKYVCKHPPIRLENIHGDVYYSEVLTGLFMRKKAEVHDIHEEELDEYNH